MLNLTRQFHNVMSLGMYCQVAWALDMSGIPYDKNPFYDMHSPQINRFVAGGFEDFFLWENLKIVGETASFTQGNYWKVRDKLSKFTSTHDFPRRKSVKDYYPTFMRDREMLFSRFSNIVKRSPSMLFVRANKDKESKEATIELRDRLALARKGKPFELWVFQNADFMLDDWQVPNLRTFRDGRWDFYHVDRRWVSGGKMQWDRKRKLWITSTEAYWNNIFRSVVIKPMPNLLV